MEKVYKLHKISTSCDLDIVNYRLIKVEPVGFGLHSPLEVNPYDLTSLKISKKSKNYHNYSLLL